MSWLYAPWPWYVVGPLIGLMVPLLLLLGSKSFGISANLQHLCALTQPRNVNIEFFRYNWREHLWSMLFLVGVVIGGSLASGVFANPNPIALSPAFLHDLLSWGYSLPTSGLLPPELFGHSLQSWALLFFGGVLIGWGTRYAYGCTSGHAITGLSTFQLPSLFAVLGIFGGGLLASWIWTPVVLAR